jgi:predicted metal-dependent phosphoesterase TrpH
VKLVELHCHTIYSNSKTTECLTTPRQLLEAAKSRGLSAIAITDHDTMDGYKKAKLLAKEYGITLIPAVEIDTDCSGQILAYGIKTLPPAGLTPVETIKAVHDQGGVAIIPHPFDLLRKMPNIKNVFKHADGIEVANYGAVFNTRSRRFAKTNGIKVTTAGSDAHHRSLIGTAIVGFPDECKSVDDYLKAFKKGDFQIVINRSYPQALSIGMANIVYTRSVGFLWKVFPSKRLTLEVDGVFYLVKFVVKAPFKVSLDITKIVYKVSGLSWALSKIT